MTNVGQGQYQYVFNTKAPAGFDVTATHAIRVYGSRDLDLLQPGYELRQRDLQLCSERRQGDEGP